MYVYMYVDTHDIFIEKKEAKFLFTDNKIEYIKKTREFTGH